MPAGAVATGVPGEDIIDLGVCIKLLKKSIVLIPLVIMIVIYVIKVTLTHHHEEEGVSPQVGDALLAHVFGNSSENSTSSSLSQEDRDGSGKALFAKGSREEEEGEETVLAGASAVALTPPPPKSAGVVVAPALLSVCALLVPLFLGRRRRRRWTNLKGIL